MSKANAPGNQNQTLKFESPHKFFHMMMNMCDDDLDLHQYRLYGHYLRVAGDGGLCTESVRTTASKCRMGHTTVIRVRRELAKLGYIKVDEPTVEAAQRGETVKIEVINRWTENIARYSKAVPDEKQQPIPVPIGEQGVPNQEHLPVTTQEQTVPNGESKKNILKTNPEEPKERTTTPAEQSVKPESLAAPNGNSSSGSRYESSIAGVFLALEQNFIDDKDRPIKITPFIAEDIKDLTEEMQPEYMLHAIKLSCEQDKKTISYLKGILRKWRTEGKPTLQKSVSGAPIDPKAYTDGKYAWAINNDPDAELGDTA